MTYSNAQKLRKGDEVRIKATGQYENVLYTIDRKGRKEVIIMLTDGYEYRHTEIA